MKKIYAAMVLMSLVNSLAAQPVLTDENFNPVPGQTGTEYDFDATGFDPGPSGPGVTWNYPVLPASAPHNVNVYSAFATPHAPHFSGCNVAISRGVLDYDYYLAHATGLDYYGRANSTYTMALSDPARVFAYPMTFLSVSSDSLEGTFGTSEVTTTRQGQVVTEADGYGTLVTPMGSFMDVLRIKSVWTYDDEVYDGTTTVTYHHEDTYYYWAAEEVHLPLMIYAEKKTTGIGTVEISYTGMYLDPESLTTGLEDEQAFARGFVMYPNPARSAFVSLWLRNNRNESVNLIVWDVAGKQKYSNTYQLVEGNNQLLVDINSLTAGIYFVEISNASGKTVRKLVKE